MTAVEVDHLEVQRGTITGADRAQRGRQDHALQPAHRLRHSRTPARWSFDGRKPPASPAYKVAALGMVRTFQLTKALSRLTVMDNMMLGAAAARREAPDGDVRPLWRSAGERHRGEGQGPARALQARLEKRDDYAGSLSGGQRKLLEMARALMSDPRLVMLDEPMAGVNPALTQSLLGHIQRSARRPA